MGDVDIASAAFIDPLKRAADLVEAELAPARVVLLGSVATGKYVDTLLGVFGARLEFPSSFVGRGDMSRGGLLLRAARWRRNSTTPLDPGRGAAQQASAQAPRLRLRGGSLAPR
jgi:hypothetical protein